MGIMVMTRDINSYFDIPRGNYVAQFWHQQGGNKIILGDPEVTANIYCNSRNLPNTDTQNYSTDLR